MPPSGHGPTPGRAWVQCSRGDPYHAPLDLVSVVVPRAARHPRSRERLISYATGGHAFAACGGPLRPHDHNRGVVYDTHYVSTRACWMFRLFGHDSVMILDGGLGQWLASAARSSRGG